eukprot:gene18725-25256_t
MGCGASKEMTTAVATVPTVPTVELPHHISIERWTQRDVSAWFMTLPPDLSQFSSQLLPADGRLLLEWDEKVLVSSGVSLYQAKKLMLLRSDLMAACHQGATGATEAARGSAIVEQDKTHKTTRSLTQTLLVVARKSLPAAAKISRQLGEVQPFPGSTACATLAVILGMVDTSLGNKDKVLDLALRAAELMDFVSHSREELTNGNLAFKALVGRFSDLLQDESARVHAAVESLGGEAFVMADSNKRRQLVELLGLDKKLVLAAVDSLAANMDKGVHCIIKHLDMRVFWHQFFSGRDCVPWKLWWVQFPSELGETCPQLSEGDIKKLEECLETRKAKDAFEAALERGDADNISVDEVKLSFPPGAELVQHIVSMIGSRGASSSADTTPKLKTAGASLGFGLPSVDPLYVERERGYVEGLIRKMASLGNDSASAGCVSCLCLVGGGGLGKSNIALDMGLKMWRQGLVPGGAVMVDLREARSLLDLAGRFCAALSVDKASDAVTTMLNRLKKVSSHFMLMVDNAEDILCTSSTALLLLTSRQALPAIDPPLEASAGAGWGVQNVDLTSLGPAAAEKLVRSIAPALVLGDIEVAALVAACKGTPLLLRVLTDALANGRITLADVQKVAIAHDTGGGGGGASIGISSQAVVETVALIVRALPDLRLQKTLQQLSVFSSGWEPEGAAAVMACDEVRAMALVQQLYRHGLALYDSSACRYFLHMAVRSAVDAGHLVEAAVQGEGVGERFVRYVLGLMGDWVHLMEGKSSALALRQARSHEGDVSTVLDILTNPKLNEATAIAAATAIRPSYEGLLDSFGLLISKQSLAAWRCVEHLLSGADRELGAVHLCISWHLGGQGDLTGALAEAEAAEEEMQRILGPEHPDTLLSLNNLAGCLRDLGRSSDALPSYKRSLEVRERTLGPEHPDTLGSVNGLASCLSDLGWSSDALPLYERALEVRERTLGPEHPRTLGSLSNMASCLSDLGRVSDALPLYERALEVRERTLGPEHPSTLGSLTCLASCLDALGRSSKALPLYERALAVRERTLGPEHPSTLGSLGGLADCLSALGRSSDALPLYERALEVSERTLGPDHPDTLGSLINLAYCLNALGRSSEALPLYERALAVSERTLGPEHPSTLGSLTCLASCLDALGRSSKALPLYERTLAVRERTLGPEHPSTLGSLGGLADCLSALGRSSDALPLYERALEVSERTLGPDHPDTLGSLINLAYCLNALGRSSEALPLYERALAVSERTLGPEHPSTLGSLTCLASCLDALGRSSKALPLYERALAVRERTLGPEHPSTLGSLGGLANCLSALGKSNEALPLYERALAVSERTLGPEHPSTLGSLSGLASCLSALGRSSDALPLYERTLAVEERTLGPEHPSTLDSLNNLANCLGALGRSSDALPLYERTLAVSERTLGPEHPDTLMALNNLANCISTLGRCSDALPLYERTLAVEERTLGPEHPDALRSLNNLANCLGDLGRERTLGPEHPDTLESLNNQANCLRALGRSSDALPVVERALAGRERTLGPEHPYTLESLNNQANCLRALGRSSDALPVVERALGVRERTLGPEHPNTLESLNNQANCLRALGRSSDALPVVERALAGRERTLGPEHPDTLDSLNNQANCLHALGRSSDALLVVERALAGRERTLGPEHPDTLESLNNHANCLCALGRSSDALPVVERALAERERTLGPEHPDTLVSLDSLASCLRDLGRSSDADSLVGLGAAAAAATLRSRIPKQ